MSFDFNIALTGIGPHSNTKLSSNMNSIQMALYADNGSGKSFISKSFKRISDLKYLDRTDQSQIDLLVEKSTAMVRFGEKQGILSLSILVRNKIVSKKFLLSDGAISDFKDDYVMPYTANLLDIYKVSIGGMKPIHTIPNQIRHVLETTYRFEGSCGGFDDYILNNEILGKNGCLYSLIEDHSHGGLRTSKGYTDNMLIDSCRMVVDFIASKYPGQIEEVKRLSA